MIHPIPSPFVSSEVETRLRLRVSTSLDPNGGGCLTGEVCR